VPEISRFFGIVIGMFYSEHGLPYFHAVYGGDKASITIVGAYVSRGLAPAAGPPARA
jgi:hypothetical protein